MKRMKAFDFELVRVNGPAMYSCRFIMDNDTITIFGNSVEEVFYQCQTQFPEGLIMKGLVFSGRNNVDARKNLSEFLSLGFRTGYFKKLPTEDDYESDQ